MTTLAGARVLITGASRGVGAALAHAFAAEGAVPALVARDEAAITALADELSGRAYPADLAAGTEGLVQRVEADGGPIDILVNNAGATQAGALFRQARSRPKASRTRLRAACPRRWGLLESHGP